MYPIVRDANDVNLTCHSSATINDPSGTGPGIGGQVTPT
jgi:hypothetical protein